MAFWYCLDHKLGEGSESSAAGCRAEVRLGPYPSADAAANALQSVKAREERITAEDRAWDGEDH